MPTIKRDRTTNKFDKIDVFKKKIKTMGRNEKLQLTVQYHLAQNTIAMGFSKEKQSLSFFCNEYDTFSYVSSSSFTVTTADVTVVKSIINNYLKYCKDQKDFITKGKIVDEIKVLKSGFGRMLNAKEIKKKEQDITILDKSIEGNSKTFYKLLESGVFVILEDNSPKSTAILDVDKMELYKIKMKQDEISITDKKTIDIVTF